MKLLMEKNANKTLKIWKKCDRNWCEKEIKKN